MQTNGHIESNNSRFIRYERSFSNRICLFLYDITVHNKNDAI